ncbi:MAG TPA: hypothetical protein PKL78_06345 [Anaerolineales bacterium]|nr:hypothetical protein [Anaerolineales bacterium]HNN13161.1 hypothetical protein [Anaerolineales bacterium]
MNYKTPSLISALITILVLLLLAVIGAVFMLVLLNGFSERAGGAALTSAIVCQGIGILLSGLLAWRLPRMFMERFQWNGPLAVTVSILAGTFLGGGLSLISMFISVFVAEAVR